MIKLGQLTSGISLIIFLLFPFIANAKKLPSTEEFQSLLTVCAAGAGITIDGQMKGSITSIYSDAKSSTEAKNFKFITAADFLNKLPDSDRLAGYKIYNDCILKILDIDKGDKGLSHIRKCAYRDVESCKKIKNLANLAKNHCIENPLVKPVDKKGEMMLHRRCTATSGTASNMVHIVEDVVNKCGLTGDRLNDDCLNAKKTFTSMYPEMTMNKLEDFMRPVF